MGDKTKKKRLSIILDPDDEAQQDFIKLLNLCGRKRSKLTNIFAKEIIENYGLDMETLTKEKLLRFIDSYDYIREYRGASVSAAVIPTVGINEIGDVRPKDSRQPAQSLPKPKIEPVKSEKKETGFVTEKTDTIDEEKANLALSAFGL